MGSRGRDCNSVGLGLAFGLSPVKKGLMLSTLYFLPIGAGLSREAGGPFAGRSRRVAGPSRVTALAVCLARTRTLLRRLCRSGPKIGRWDERVEITTAGEASLLQVSVGGRSGRAEMVSGRVRP